MPDYFWIPLASIVSLTVGFASGYWVSRQNKVEELEEIHHWLGKLAGKANHVEKLFIDHPTRPQSKSTAFVSTPVSGRRLVSDVQSVIDQITRIEGALSRLGSKDNVESQRAGVEDSSGHGEITQEYVPDRLGEAQFPVPDEDENDATPDTPHAQEPYARIIQLYNLGVDDRAARDRFRNEYTITRIGNNKAVAQRLGEVSSPEFRKLDNGNFLAVPDARGSFYVLPWFDSTLNSSAYNEGGFDHVFFCPGYDPETAYTVVRVRRPAVFRQDGDAWVRVEKGELILQR